MIDISELRDRLVGAGLPEGRYVVRDHEAWLHADALDAVEAGGVVTDVEIQGGVTVATCEVWLDRGDDRVVVGTAEVVRPAA